MKQFALSVHTREKKGTGSSRALRRNGKVPAVIYGKSGTESLVVENKALRSVFKASAGSVSLVELQNESGKKTLAVVQAYQRHPLKDFLLHVDFKEVRGDEPLHVSLPIHVVGESIGVKNEDGLIEFRMHEVEARALPRHFPEFITVDISELRVGDAIHVEHLPVLEGLQYVSKPDAVVIMCSAQKNTEGASAVAAEPAAAEGSAEK